MDGIKEIEGKGAEILGSCKIQKNGRMVIPKKVRELLGIDTGDTVTINIDDNAVTLTKA